MVVCVCVSTEQDRGLDQLSLALRRQREVGLAIQEEVEEQNGKDNPSLLRNPSHNEYNHLRPPIINFPSY